MAKIIHTSGTRKRARARATIREGKGIVKINGKMLDVFEPEMARMKIREPLLLVKDVSGKVDIDVNVHGGGVISGADAARLAVGRALADYTGKAGVKETLSGYDRKLLVPDVRHKEPCKPNVSKPRKKRQKSYR
ncbi:MAG: 30S ribosomal protein S9 [Candidatus Woesearchaeota archaeon]